MENRPHFNKSIKELGVLYAQNSDDAGTLADLEVELGFRSTQRALTLKSRGGSVYLNRSELFRKWISRSVTPRPGLVAA